MEGVVYLQCDSRYNEYLLKEINGKKVIEYVVEKIKRIGEFPIVTSIYACDDNRELIDFLKEFGGISVIESKEEAVTKRFFEAIEGYDGYVIRVCGDQPLLDSEQAGELLRKIDGYDFFYEETIANCVLPDIVSIAKLKEKCNEILNVSRYYHALVNDNTIRRFRYGARTILHRCRTCDFLSFSFVKRVIENNLDIYELGNALVKRLNAYHSNLYVNGILTSWMLGDSAIEFFYDINGKISPWWCEAAVNLVREKIQNLANLRVFEWGSGNSTLFWSDYAKEVVAVEYDRAWYEKVKSILPRNASVRYCELEYGGSYCKNIAETDGQWDIILIDGRDRVRCAMNCVEKLSANGVIIWDNSDRSYYGEGYKFLKECGFRRLELSGILWGIPEVKDYTSIFYRDNNLFEL